MQLQPPDQLSTTLIWISAIFMAVRAGVEAWPSANKALPFMSWGWLAFVPLLLLLVAALRSISVSTTEPMRPPPMPEQLEMQDAQSSERQDGETPNPDYLPQGVTREYLTLMLSRPTELQVRRFLKPYSGKWMTLELTIMAIYKEEDSIRAQLRYFEDDEESEFIWAYFDAKWEDHLHQWKAGEAIRFRGKVQIRDYGYPNFTDAIPL